MRYKTSAERNIRCSVQSTRLLEGNVEQQAVFFGGYAVWLDIKIVAVQIQHSRREQLMVAVERTEHLHKLLYQDVERHRRENLVGQLVDLHEKRSAVIRAAVVAGVLFGGADGHH